MGFIDLGRSFLAQTVLPDVAYLLLLACLNVSDFDQTKAGIAAVVLFLDMSARVD